MIVGAVRLADGQEPPRYYGLSHYELDRDCSVWYPVPFHLLSRCAVRFRIAFDRWRSSPSSSAKRTLGIVRRCSDRAYRRGYAEGSRDASGKFLKALLQLEGGKQGGAVH